MQDYSQLINRTLADIKPSGIRRFFDIANEMEDVISLSIGEPDFSTPWHIREVGIRSLEEGRTWYTANAGMLRLRQAISDFTARRTGVTYDPATDIVVTVGGSEAIDLAFRAILNPGDEVLIPVPSFVCYEPLCRMAGGVPVMIETRAEDGFRLTAEGLRAAITPRTKALVLPFPNNPTGSIMRREHLEEIAGVLRDTDILVVSDEIYSELTYGGERHCSLVSLPGMAERTLFINGFSKGFAMTGWRLGYLCGPAPILKAIVKLHQYGIMSAPTTAQFAAIEALEQGEEDIARMRGEYDMRRRLIVKELNGMGLTCFDPEGAFYVFPSIRKTGLSSEDFCRRLLEEEHVAVVPGNAFGDCGEGFVRISYCYSLEHITEALRRMKRFLKQF